jgi:hypothetical protein
MFNLGRFMRLAKAHWAEYWKTYAWFIGIGIMIHFVLLLLMLAGDGLRSMRTNSQQVVYYAGLFLTAPIFAARYFQAMARRESALIILMRPASVFEKWLLAFLVVAILYPIAYTMAFYVCNFPAYMIAQPVMRAVSTDISDYQLFFILTEPEPGALITVALSLTSYQAFGVLGSLYFKRMPFIKTLVIAFLILLVSIFISIIFDARVEQLMSYWINHSEHLTVRQWLYPFAWISVPALLWMACYFALNEREAA